MSQVSSLEWSATKVRSTFIDFFKTKKHEFVPSSPVLPYEDPTLLFINSGMCQFKSIFQGTIDPSTLFGALKRAVNSQKCIRAGGKHNDLDDVGKDTYHHTFFEMLGNWSFGDYFKKEAIEWAFELLTKVYGLDKSRLYATYFEGDISQGLQPDLEAKALWLKFLPEDQVIPGNAKDNFWEMGNVGPCGPCSELHYDRIGGRNAAFLVNQDDPNVIEIWNLVFMQYNRELDGSLIVLPHKHIDTGMGFERLVSVLQDKPSNYDTDVFSRLFDEIHSKTKASRKYQGLVGSEDSEGIDMAYRVVADHIRNVSIAIADGILPGNEGRSYVIRRILRRAVRYGRQFLHGDLGFFAALVPVVVDELADAFPELKLKQEFIQKTVEDEEESFARTLDHGMDMFRKYAAKTKEEGKNVICGEDAFRLYDTFGFPVDLTEIMADEVGMKVDIDGYEAELTAAKKRSKEGGSSFLAEAVFEADQIAQLQSLGVESTNDDAKYIWEPMSALLKAVYISGEFPSVANVSEGGNALMGLVLDSTNFYAESGGQVGDSGTITSKDGSFLFQVQVTNSYGGFTVHWGNVVKGSCALNELVECNVDFSRRGKIAPNHTCTHLLNFALRKVLAGEVDQMGSLVDEDRLRFDYSQSKPLDEKQVTEIETLINNIISKQCKVYTKLCSLESAQNIGSLRAVFGEKYPDPVRVISVGQDIEPMLEDPENESWNDVSVEFCGGTHLSNTKQAQRFVLVSEEGIAKGVRRIVAFTGQKAVDCLNEGQQMLDELCSFKSNGAELLNAISKYRTKLNETRSGLSFVTKSEIEAKIDVLVKKANKEVKKQTKVNQKKVSSLVDAKLASVLESDEKILLLDADVGADGAALGPAARAVIKKHKDVALFLVSCDKDTGRLIVFGGVGSDRQSEHFDALKWVQGALAPFGGKGGGDASAAQGQADVVDIDGILATAKDLI